FSLAEVLAIALFVALVIQQLVQLRPRKHVVDAVALVAAVAQILQRGLGRSQRGPERGQRVQDHTVAQSGQGCKVQVGAAAELGRVRKKRSLDGRRKRGKPVGSLQRLGKNRVRPRFKKKRGWANGIVKAGPAACVRARDDDKIRIGAGGDRR